MVGGPAEQANALVSDCSEIADGDSEPGGQIKADAADAIVDMRVRDSRLEDDEWNAGGL